MFKRNCVVKYVDNFGVEHAAKVEAESLFEAAVRGLHRLDSSFWAEDDVFDRMSVTVEVYEEADKLIRLGERALSRAPSPCFLLALHFLASTDALHLAQQGPRETSRSDLVLGRCGICGAGLQTSEYYLPDAALAKAQDSPT
jgi:hypothetical protein